MEAGVPGWENTLELMAPLRAINNAMPTAPTAAQQHVEVALQGTAHDVGSVWGAEVGGLGWEGTQLLPFEHPALPAETQRSAAEVAAAALAAAGTGPGSSVGEGTEEASRSSQDGTQGQELVQEDGDSCMSGHAHGSAEDEVGGDADVGLMSLWGLLNLSNYEPAQVSICHHGLYTLLRMVHRSMDPRRRSSAAAILTNIHYNPGNATTLYKAEIKLKFAALLRLRGLSQEARKAKLQQLPLQIKPNSMKAKSLARNVASKNSPKKQADGKGSGALGAAAARRPSTQEKSTKGVRALATSQLEKGLQQMQASMTKDETPPEDQQAHKSPYLMGGRDAAESESGSVVEDPAALETKLAFLRWVVEPGVQVLGDQPAPEELGAGDLAGGAGVTAADLMSRLTNDPEEEAWLAYISSVAAMDDFEQTRYVQGDYLRGSLTRSLAEGAQSLWQSRPVRGPASPPSKSSPRASLRPATANPLRSSKAAASEKAQGNSSPRTAADPEDESSGATPIPHAASSAGKKSSAQKGSTRGSSGPHPRARPTDTKPLRSGSGRAKKDQGGETSKGEGEEVDGGVSGNGTSTGPRQGGEEDGSPSGGNKKHRSKTRINGKPSSAAPRDRPSTAPPAQAGLRCTAGGPLRPASGSLPMWSPHIKGYIQDRNKAGKPSNILAECLLRAGIPESTTEHLASLADEILENKTVKQGRRAAEEAVAAEAAARKAAEEEAEAERLREAGIAEELQVLDLTRFDSIRSLNRRRSSMGRARFSSFGGAHGAPSECSENEGAQSKRRMSRSMSRALSVAVVRASQRGEARAADRAAEYAAKAADAAEAARLPERKMAQRGFSSKRAVPNDSTSTRQNSSTNNSTSTHRTSFASSVSEAGWPKAMVNASLEEAAKEEVVRLLGRDCAGWPKAMVNSSLGEAASKGEVRLFGRDCVEKDAHRISFASLISEAGWLTAMVNSSLGEAASKGEVRLFGRGCVEKDAHRISFASSISGAGWFTAMVNSSLGEAASKEEVSLSGREEGGQ
ncbi:hypothetical protein DUNSADRAFT_5591 [Dunaliella salina]|uniref:Uncharacterized protein n=1 Tax=Dunaliella salina TaxID=3046 RepID=A0ABQ7GPY8_DUNSA|nr:hypothetical protein DUNSADRAFT_5591 [Dunaliella salina]|eukprot:KAF5836665.1 hypothetical protein DUNSADRAFT_5591 [Dunaliella salina]